MTQLHRLIPFTTLVALAAALLLGQTTAHAQGATPAMAGCASTYTVKRGDYLVRVAQQEMGNPRYFYTIFNATNKAAQTDRSFARLYSPDVIFAGQKLCIPAQTAATASGGTPGAADQAPTSQAAGQTAAGPAGGPRIYTRLTPAADASGLAVTLVLYPDNKATFVSDYIGKASVVQQGTWTNEGANTRVDLTTQDGKPQNQTLTFEPDGEKLSFGNADPRVYGSQGLTLTPNPYIGTYQGDLPAADASGRKVTLVLAPDLSATLTQEYVGKGTFTQTGTWRAGNQGAVVTLTQQNGKPNRETMTFRWNGDTLVMVDYDRVRWGTVGLSVKRVSLPIATLVGFVRYMQRSALTPDAVMTVQLVQLKAGADPTVVSTTNVYPAGKQVPLGFVVRYEPNQIDVTQSYGVQASISEGGKEAFKSAQPTPVITQGNPTSGLELLVVPA